MAYPVRTLCSLFLSLLVGAGCVSGDPVREADPASAGSARAFADRDSGGAAPKAPGLDRAHDDHRFAELLKQAHRQAERDGLGTAMPAYLEAIALDPAHSRAHILRYQLALRWLERNEVAAALDMLAAILEHEPEHPLAAPLRRELLGEPVPVPEPVAEPPPQPETPVLPADVLAAMRPVRILLDRAGSQWPVELPEGAWNEQGVLAVPAGWRGTLDALGSRRWQRLTGPDGQSLRLRMRDWHGEAGLWRSGRGIVMELPLETYLVGVVSTEMSTSWHIEALKAQAVAARTYVVRALLEVPAGRAYDVRGDVMDQAFRPTATVGPAARAVGETAGEVLLWQDKPARIFFHADNGGISEDPRFVWGHRLPYYEIRRDPFSDRVPAWEARIPVAEWTRRLRLPPPRGVTLQRSPSGRVARVVWFGNDGSRRELRGNDVRLALDPRRIRSLLFDLEREGDVFVLTGRGYGHGVGMSQWGARTMADRGMRHDEILAHYYPGVDLLRSPASARLHGADLP